MIGVESQYLFSIFLKDQPNIISEEDMLSFTIIEVAGLNLPYYEVAFNIKDKANMEYFNDKNVLNIQLGKDINSLKDTLLHMEKVIESPAQQDVGTIIIRGVQDSKPYLVNDNVAVYQGTSDVVLQSLASKYGYKPTLLIDKMDDEMAWQQNSMTDYAFANKVWLHSYSKDNSFVITSFNIENEFRMYDIVKCIGDQNIKYNFVTSKPENDKETQIHSNFETDNNTSMNNFFGGYVKQMHIYNVKERKFELVDIGNTVPIISEADTSNTDASISKSGGFRIQTPDMHAKYFRAEMLNKARLFNMNSSRIWVTIEDEYSDIHPLDLCTVLAKESGNQSCEQVSGMYMVSKVVRTIQDRRLTTSALLCRESFNNQR